MPVIVAPRLLLPKAGLDQRRWAVIACDQHTSEPALWDKLAQMIGQEPSTLRMIYPEAYLGRPDEEERIQAIDKTIDRYLKDGTLVDHGPGFVLVERLVPGEKKRLGIVLAIDLEAYTYAPGVKSPIRASEQTIIARIPPRLKIRRHAGVEVSHTLVLYDDPSNAIVRSYYDRRKEFEMIYDVELTLGGGHLRGWFIPAEEKLIARFAAIQKANKDDLLFIVGDGNHSLATAKAYWDEIKAGLTAEERKTHPARFALVEAISVYDEGLTFEPIHRIIYDADDDLIKGLQSAVSGPSQSFCLCKDERVPLHLPLNGPKAYHDVQGFLDAYLEAHPKARIDYVHDEAHVISIIKEHPEAIGIIMPALGADDVFAAIGRGEVLTRKAFSLGSACGKRYYYEARKIR